MKLPNITEGPWVAKPSDYGLQMILTGNLKNAICRAKDEDHGKAIAALPDLLQAAVNVVNADNKKQVIHAIGILERVLIEAGCKE